jgi:hypothetical protein
MMGASAQRDQSCCDKTRNNRSGALKRGEAFALEHSKLLAKGKHFEASVGAAADEHPNHGQEGGMRARIKPCNTA